MGKIADRTYIFFSSINIFFNLNANSIWFVLIVIIYHIISQRIIISTIYGLNYFTNENEYKYNSIQAHPGHGYHYFLQSQRTSHLVEFMHFQNKQVYINIYLFIYEYVCIHINIIIIIKMYTQAEIFHPVRRQKFILPEST